ALGGFNGEVASIRGGFNNIDILVASKTAGGTLSGIPDADATATWSLPGPNGDSYQISTSEIELFSNFTQLVGATTFGSGDVFHITGTNQSVNITGGGGTTAIDFSDGASPTGKIDGGTGPSKINGPNIDPTWTINGPNAGTADFITGGFSNIDSLIGGSGPDT